MKFGIIGRPLIHSWSPDYFAKKFAQLSMGATYERFTLHVIEDFPKLLTTHPTLAGLNVTVPYKEQILPFLDKIDEVAKTIGAVNCIKIINGKTIGFNTDIIGLKNTLAGFLPKDFHGNGLILGTGGAAKAVAYVLKQHKISVQFVSRTKTPNNLLYADLNREIINSHHLIINATPVGMWPYTEDCPNIPYHLLSPKHYLLDLIYNPSETLFLAKGKQNGSQIKNGEEMLLAQAAASLEIWQNQKG